MEEIFDKYDIPKDARYDITKEIDKLIKNSSSTDKSAKITITKTNNTDNPNQCKGFLYKGTKKQTLCTSPAKDNGYCGRHNPNKTKTTTKSSSNTDVVKCHAIIKKTGKQCLLNGTVKPENSEFNYCKRHSEKWSEFEKPSLINNDKDDNEDNIEENDEEDIEDDTKYIKKEKKKIVNHIDNDDNDDIDDILSMS